MDSNILLLPVLLLMTTCSVFAPPEEANLSNASDSVPVPDTISPEEQKAEEQWAVINQDNVEKHCLSQAKQVAVEEGHPSLSVFSCSCQGSENSEEKSYRCTISAADGKHEITVDCVKAERECIIFSETGTDVYTFDDLQELLAE